MNDLYARLNLTRSATADEVRGAWRRVARATHPDQGGDLASFQGAKEAWDTLSDPGARAIYDIANPAAGTTLPSSLDAAHGDAAVFTSTGMAHRLHVNAGTMSTLTVILGEISRMETMHRHLQAHPDPEAKNQLEWRMAQAYRRLAPLARAMGLAPAALLDDPRLALEITQRSTTQPPRRSVITAPAVSPEILHESDLNTPTASIDAALNSTVLAETASVLDPEVRPEPTPEPTGAADSTTLAPDEDLGFEFADGIIVTLRGRSRYGVAIPSPEDARRYHMGSPRILASLRPEDPLVVLPAPTRRGALRRVVGFLAHGPRWLPSGWSEPASNLAQAGFLVGALAIMLAWKPPTQATALIIFYVGLIWAVLWPVRLAVRAAARAARWWAWPVAATLPALGIIAARSMLLILGRG